MLTCDIMHCSYCSRGTVRCIHIHMSITFICIYESEDVHWWLHAAFVLFTCDPTLHSYLYIIRLRTHSWRQETIWWHSHDLLSCDITYSRHKYVQGGEDPQDALSCRSFFAKEPPIIGLFCRKWLIEIRHPMRLRHPVRNFTSEQVICDTTHSYVAWRMHTWHDSLVWDTTHWYVTRVIL